MEESEKKEKEVNKTAEKSAKEAKKGKRQWVTTVEQGLDCIKNDPVARATLVELRRSGFDEKKIAGCIVRYCGGKPEDAKAGLKAAKDCGEALAEAAKQLRTAANYVERASRMCEQCGWPVSAVDELPETLRGSAKGLSNTAARIKDSLKNIRIGGGKSKRDGTRRLRISSGRDDILLCFAYALFDGKKPVEEVYLQIAKLVAAVTGEPRNYIPMAERLRKSVERLASTEWGRQLIMMAEEADYLGLKPPTLTPGT